MAVTGRLGVAPSSPWQKPRARRLEPSGECMKCRHELVCRDPEPLRRDGGVGGVRVVSHQRSRYRLVIGELVAEEDAQRLGQGEHELAMRQVQKHLLSEVLGE